MCARASQRVLPVERMYRQYLRQREAKMASGGKLKVLLILGSIRDGRQGLRVAKFMRRKLEERNFDVKFFGKSIYIYIHVHVD